MGTNKVAKSQIRDQKWIRDGRGAGHGSDYKPWLTVRDVPSEGRSHRVFGHNSQRTHHLLSDLELAVFLLVDWNPITKDVREQFPLKLEDTLDIAEACGIPHPAMLGVPQIMTSDFLIDTNVSNDSKFVLQAKYASNLEDPRTIEKLEIERKYWERKEIPWKVVTERDVPRPALENIKWLYASQRDELLPEQIIARTNFYIDLFKRSPRKRLIDITKEVDLAYSLALGESLAEVRELLAKRCFSFDIMIPIQKLKTADLRLENIVTLARAYHVSN